VIKSDQSIGYAEAAAGRFLKTMPQDPQQRQDQLTKVIIDAMITEQRVLQRFMCAKCQASHSAYRRSQGGAS